MSDHINCAGRVSRDRMGMGSCTRAATVQREGKWWCYQHDPARERERDEARAARHDARWAQQEQAHASAAALAALIGAGRPHYEKGFTAATCLGWTGGIVLTSAEAASLARRVGAWTRSEVELPPEGRAVLVTYGLVEGPFVAKLSEAEEWHEWVDDTEAAYGVEGTYWRDLPAPPEVEEAR